MHIPCEPALNSRGISAKELVLSNALMQYFVPFISVAIFGTAALKLYSFRASKSSSKAVVAFASKRTIASSEPIELLTFIYIKPAGNVVELLINVTFAADLTASFAVSTGFAADAFNQND